MASAAPGLAAGQAVLRDLLHSVSQPLTTLHCALESSLAHDARDRDDVSVALQQTDRVIETVRLMREYLDAEQAGSSTAPAPLAPALDEALCQLSVLAEAGGVSLFGLGTSTAVVALRKTWLFRALTYLVGSLIENAGVGRAVVIVLRDCGSQIVLSGNCIPILLASSHGARSEVPINELMQVKLAIARRALESIGATVEIAAGNAPSFVIRFARATHSQRTPPSPPRE
jgi:hypothetical protein